MDSWQEVVDFMNEICPECGCFLNNSPDCDPGPCVHRGQPELCDEWSAKIRAN